VKPERGGPEVVLRRIRRALRREATITRRWNVERAVAFEYAAGIVNREIERYAKPKPAELLRLREKK
jgi:hypothetical protein